MAFMVVVMTVAGASAAATAFFMIMWFHILLLFYGFLKAKIGVFRCNLVANAYLCLAEMA